MHKNGQSLHSTVVHVHANAGENQVVNAIACTGNIADAGTDCHMHKILIDIPRWYTSVRSNSIIHPCSYWPSQKTQHFMHGWLRKMNTLNRRQCYLFRSLWTHQQLGIQDNCKEGNQPPEVTFHALWLLTYESKGAQICTEWKPSPSLKLWISPRFYGAMVSMWSTENRWCL